MNSLPYIIAAFFLGAALVWLNVDDRRHAEQQANLYRDMVCLHQADLRMGKRPIDARGWPNYKGIKVECD